VSPRSVAIHEAGALAGVSSASTSAINAFKPKKSTFIDLVALFVFVLDFALVMLVALADVALPLAFALSLALAFVFPSLAVLALPAAPTVNV